MKRLLFPFLTVIAIILLLFLGFPSLETTFSDWISSSAQQTKSYFALISFSLLSLDVFLPVPSSIIMFFNGSVLGFWMGGLLSLSSSLVSTIVGYYFGKAFYHRMNRQYSQPELNRAYHIIEQYGFAGLIATRGIPILSEAIAMLCGNLAYSFQRFFAASLIGYLPICLMYAFIGSHSMDTNSFLWAFGVNVVVAGVFLAVNFKSEKLMVKE